MENLEEVLQALDEFQKLRPSVIPQELEDYLCWVAKTGDPVYQWPLIKTLVREKLTRVMTDFYENCTTLEITPCPNVEHFNYDTMKSNLLERLESFANAPFTVQRICELLTAPRKEYNRVDKFMRAIEKNILVVSTREPGPITRRGETGDGLVNGSVEEDAASVTQQQLPPPSPSQLPSQQQQPQQPQPSSQTTQPPAQPTTQDVDMEYWEKDCSSTVTISVHTVENEPPLLHSGVIPPADSALAKNLFVDEAVREKFEQAASRTDIASSNYITAVSDFSTISNLNLQPHGPVPEAVATAVPVVQSLSAVGTVSDDSVIPGADIAVAIMNEDTSSQPNLDMENEEIEATMAASTTTSTVTTMTTTAAVTAITATTTTTTATSTTTTSTPTVAAAAATTTVTVVATVIPLTTDTTRKLQAAFQAKRFDSGDNKCADNPDEKTTDRRPSTLDSAEEEIGRSVKNEEATLTKSNPERMDLNEMSHSESRLTENLLQTDIEMRSDALADNVESVIEERTADKPEEGGATSILDDIDEEDLRSTGSHNANATAFVESQSREKNSAVTSDECVSAVIVSSSEALYKTEESEIHSEETSATISSTECFVRDQPTSQKAETVETVGKVLEAFPTVASSNSNTNGQQVQEPEFNDDNLNIMEISNDKMALVEPIASDPISVIDKPKETASVIEKLDPISFTVETTESSDNVSCRSPKDDKLTGVQDNSLANSQGNKATACITIKGNQSSVIESVACRRETMELMEVDDEESLSTFQQDEPMEQETMEELSKS